MNIEERILDWKAFNSFKRLVKEIMPNNPYHNYHNHVKDVYRAVKKIIFYSGKFDDRKINYDEELALCWGAIGHDIVNYNKSDDEKESAKYTKDSIILSCDYKKNCEWLANEASKIILATKMFNENGKAIQKPKTFLEKIICDADLFYLGDMWIKFNRFAEKYRIENNIPKNSRWYRFQINFLENHKYHTETARVLQDYGKQKNIEKLKEKLKNNIFLIDFKL